MGTAIIAFQLTLHGSGPLGERFGGGGGSGSIGGLLGSLGRSSSGPQGDRLRPIFKPAGRRKSRVGQGRVEGGRNRLVDFGDQARSLKHQGLGPSGIGHRHPQHPLMHGNGAGVTGQGLAHNDSPLRTKLQEGSV
jgi:hypothetical protein